MICPKCNAHIAQDSGFCPNCGANLNNKNKKNLIIALIILGIVIGSCLLCVAFGGLMEAIDPTPKTEKADTIKNSSTPAPQSPASEETPMKTLTDISELVNKSPQEIEKKLGKALKIEKVTDNPAKTFDEEREYAVAFIPKDSLLIVRFLQGKAVQFLWYLPSEYGNQNAKEFVEQFGFNVNNMKTENYSMAVNWIGTANGVEFEKISAMKMADVYNHLTVIVKKK